ncbi:hypothetical protein K7640_17745 [Micromonospora sp. PLK6-60]|uniref:hypothetical protein n=1 Tax=Micromonospora sp. PLK6-60 TaxID=2873383 RepID=UPI001CA61FAC|nr:hypothetical protein [Micromonospora sp. PLK6-60]MBY8873679.1 hypothetical protein [Micromonospora sp. PLK6-60]
MLEFIFRVMAWHESREQDRGATAVEYALILAAIIGGAAALYFLIGQNLTTTLRAACSRITQGTC